MDVHSTPASFAVDKAVTHSADNIGRLRGGGLGVGGGGSKGPKHHLVEPAMPDLGRRWGTAEQSSGAALACVPARPHLLLLAQ